MKTRHRILFLSCALLSAAIVFAGGSNADEQKPALNYFRMSKEQFAEYSRLYAPGGTRRQECRLEYLDCWQECIPGCGIGQNGQLVNCSSCYTTEQRCGKPTLVCKPEPGTSSTPPPPSGEYWTGEMDSPDT